MADGTGTPANRPKTLVEDRFNVFWKAYPRKEAKKTAFKAFQKLKPDSALLEKCLQRWNGRRKARLGKGRRAVYPASGFLDKRGQVGGRAKGGGRRKEVEILE
mgnify:CR=1 FL=1